MKKITAIMISVLTVLMILSGCSKHREASERPVQASSNNTSEAANGVQTTQTDGVVSSNNNTTVNIDDVKDYMRFLFDTPSGLSIVASNEKTDPARGLYYPTGYVHDMVSDGEYTYMLTDIAYGKEPDQCLYKASSNGGKPEYLCDGRVNSMMIHGGWIYAVDFDPSEILRISTSDGKKEVLCVGEEHNSFEILDVTETSVYFERIVDVQDPEDRVDYYRESYSRYYRMNHDGTGVEMLPLDYATFDKDEIHAQMYDGYLYYALGDVMGKNVLGRVRVDGQNNQILSDNLYGDWVVYGNAVYNICVENNAVSSGNYTNRIDKITEAGTQMIVDLGKDYYSHAGLSGYYDGSVFGYDIQTGQKAAPETVGNYQGYDMDKAKGWWRSNDRFGARAKVIDVNNAKIYFISPRDGVTEQ